MGYDPQKKILATITSSPENPFISSGETLKIVHFGEVLKNVHFHYTKEAIAF